MSVAEAQPGLPGGHFDTGDPEYSSLDGSSIPQFSLTDLPNEIILHILTEIADEDLYSLSLLSKRMHYIALPLYLARRNFGPRPENQLVLYDYNARDALRALDSALFKVRLRSLHYPVDCEKPAEDLGREIRALRTLVGSRLEELEEATIEFQNTAPSPESETISEAVLLSSSSNNNGFSAQNMGMDMDPRSESTYGLPNDLQSDFLALLDATVGTGCKSLRISHSGSQIPTIMEIKANIYTHFGGGVGPPALIRRLNRHLQVQYLLPLSRLLAGIGSGGNKKRNDLRTFYLHSPMAFHSHLSYWTIKTLNNSHIATLSISQQFCMDEGSWSLILPYVTIPTLTNLSLDSSSMQLTDVLRFLVRHHRIQELFLGRRLRLTLDLNSSRSNTSLPSLIHVSAPPHTLLLFIGPSGHISTPALSSVTILLRVGHNEHFHRRMLNEPLSSAFSHLKALKEVHLSLCFASISTSWDAPSRLRVGDCVSIHSAFSNGTCNTDNSDSVQSLVDHMELDLNVYSLPLFSLAMKLPGLITRFPQLRHLRILSLSRDKELVDGLRKEMAIRVLLSHCPQLDSVDFYYA